MSRITQSQLFALEDAITANPSLSAKVCEQAECGKCASDSFHVEDDAIYCDNRWRDHIIPYSIDQLHFAEDPNGQDEFQMHTTLKAFLGTKDRGDAYEILMLRPEVTKKYTHCSCTLDYKHHMCSRVTEYDGFHPKKVISNFADHPMEMKTTIQ